MGFAGSTEVREYPREVPKVESQVEGSPALTMASSMQHASQEPLSLSLIAKDERARTLGLVPHACLRQLLVDPSSDKTEFELESCLLEAPPDLPEASALVEGKFSEVDKNLQGKSKVLVEYKEYGQPPKRQNMTTCANPNDETRVRQLASLLSSSGSHDLRTLPFKGYVNQENRKRHAFIFKFPENALRAEPTSLHSMIDAESLTSRLSLPSRFHVAQTVSKTIGAFHADGWVHKSVRSQSIVFFQSLELPHPLAVKSPYLVNFEYSRPETAVTLFTSYDDLERNLYCHPDRLRSTQNLVLETARPVRPWCRTPRNRHLADRPQHLQAVLWADERRSDTFSKGYSEDFHRRGEEAAIAPYGSCIRERRAGLPVW